MEAPMWNSRNLKARSHPGRRWCFTTAIVCSAAGGSRRLVPPVPLEGTPVEVSLVPSVRGKVGMSEEDWRSDPEAIAQWLKWYDSLEPLEYTAQEEADLADWRRKVKEYDIAKSQQRIER